MDSGQAFFKVVRTSRKMKIPRAFVSQMQGALANRVVLRDRQKNSWPVQVVREVDNYFFYKGWEIFYTDKSLEAGDILVFEYKGENVFDFKLFGKNECEKCEGSRVKEEVEEYEIDDEEKEVGSDEVIVDGEENDEDYDMDDDEDDDEDYVSEEEDDVDDDDEDEDEDDEDCVTEKITKTQSKSSEGSNGTKTIPSKRTYKKENVPNCYGAEIFESGLALRPKNPYFVTRSRTQARKNELHIPKDVIVDYHLNIPKKLLLVDEQGRKWETNVIQWKDGRLWCTRGWRSLCNVNNIKIDNTCICEFVQKDGFMHILVRVVEQVDK